MKNYRRLIVALALALGLFISPLLALIKQVTTVGAAASTIFTPGATCPWVAIQNNGSGDVRLGLDGGVPWGRSDPTASTGYLLSHGTQIVVVYAGAGEKPVIRAILTSATTTTLDINTPDNKSN